MTHPTHKAFKHPEVQLANMGYVVAYVVSMVLMGLSLILVKDHMLSSMRLAEAILLSAAVVVIVQGVFLLHMNLSHTQIWHTFALVLFIPLFVLAIGLTAWMFHGLYKRTMIVPIMKAMPAVQGSMAPVIAPKR
ncbi:MAG TPA: hypothetical protein VMV40_05330 [Acidiferrobacter sp.]|nr:hypothetical protein [Acidiferrobacter sp.]